MRKLMGLFLVTALSTAPAVLSDASGAAAAGKALERKNLCAGEIEAPIDIRIDPNPAIDNGTTVTLTGMVVPRKDATQIYIAFGSEGMASILSSAILTGPAKAGDQIPFAVEVKFQGQGKSAVHVTAQFEGPFGSPEFSKRESLFVDIRPSDILTGRVGFLDLDRKAFEKDSAGGTTESISAGMKELARLDSGKKPLKLDRNQLTDQQKVLNTLVGAPADGYTAAAPSIESHGSVGIHISGNAQWQDENGNFHPVYGANIQIWDSDTLGDEFVDVVATDVNGDYAIVVDNNDGIGAGDRDIYVRFVTANSWVDTQTTGGSTYFSDSGVYNETPDGSHIVENFSFSAGGVNDSVSVFEAATWIAAYVAFDAEGSALPQIPIVWPNGDTKSFYDGSSVRIEEPDRYDWDTIHHEFGHYVMDVLGIEDNPGGSHNIGDCAAFERSSKDEGNRLAWGEGWPTYFGTSGQFELNLASLNVPRVGDAMYEDLEDGSVSYSMESQSSSGVGEDNELAVQRLLWDLYDSNSDSRDNISLSDNTIWDAVKAAAGSPQILSNYWGGLRSGASDVTDLEMGMIATDHQIGPGLVAPADGAIVGQSSADFSWQAYVGCPGSYSGDDFDLVFYDPGSFAPVLTIPGLSSTMYSLSAGEFSTLIGGGHEYLWSVEGRNTSSPATGPYRGETFEVIVNTPPVADAGLDIVAECASHTTTPVMMDGTGSSDADGDALSYSWTAPGVTFDNPISATPTGDYPKGMTTATLVVSDGYEDDSDTVNVDVVDTTKPMIVCPAEVTVECSQAGGTPSSDPVIDAFLSAATATDICDPNPMITHNGPAFFPLGETVVTFTATDVDGNFDDCDAKVIVEDTIPPDITLSVSPTMLWPPNHKLRNVTSTVSATDICDPNPVITLDSIVSDEPDNGIADGNTVNDIQDADLGTDDRHYKLRAERSGKGDGRVYTITHSATDSSMNSTSASADVVVPKSKGKGKGATTSAAKKKGRKKK